MPRGLWTLLRLHFRGVSRRVMRSASTFRGIIFLALVAFVLGSRLVRLWYRAQTMPHTDLQVVRDVAPFAILAFCVGNLVSSLGESAIAFSAAEVDFLFPGPFARRSLLGYKLIKTAFGTIFTSLIFSILLLGYSGSWIACFVGVWLTLQFLQLFAVATVMVGQTVGERAYSATRRAALFVVLALVLIAAAPKIASSLENGPLALMHQVHASIAGRVLLAPFDVFAQTLTARVFFPDLAAWGSLALLIDLLMVALVIGLDANYLETAVAASQRRYERLSRIRRGGIGGPSGPVGAKFRITPLPWLGGVGPIAWRQLTGAVRSSRRLVFILIVLGALVGVPLLSHRRDPSSMLWLVVFAAMWFTVVVVSSLKFDFRDDLDRFDLLRSLPIRPAAVAAAELVAPVVVLTLVHAILLIALAVSGFAAGWILLAAAAFAVPLNLLVVGVENLLFLMFPVRAVGLIAGDMQMFGRQMVISMCRMLLILLGVAASAAVGLIGYFVGRESWFAFGVMAWVALSMVAIGTVPLIARAYSRFDPSIDTPP